MIKMLNAIFLNANLIDYFCLRDELVRITIEAVNYVQAIKAHSFE